MANHPDPPVTGENAPVANGSKSAGSEGQTAASVADITLPGDPASSDAMPPFPGKGLIEHPHPPVRWREIVAVLLLVVLSDLTIYRGQGFTGYAVLFLVAPLFLGLGAVGPLMRTSLWIVGTMTVVLAVKMIWCGSLLLVAAGFALLVCFAMALSGRRPYVLESVVFASQTIWAGYEGSIAHGRHWGRLNPPERNAAWLSYLLPTVTFVVFSVLFILANPDVFTFAWDRAEVVFTQIREWFLNFSLPEVLFWIAVAWVSIGLIRPVIRRTILDDEGIDSEKAVDLPPTNERTPLYAAFRNTLITVIVLFAVYLVFEFWTLGLRTFPDNFYYAGYAHEGAAWLTLALALATVLLSVIFRGRILRDSRLPLLRALAWIWSLQNFLLAVAVYNRLFIYIGYNGMTRLRMVGIFGMSAVVIGFILVLWKIGKNRSFVWLLRRQLWTPVLLCYFYALLPVDAIVVKYNVQRIMAGDPKPSVQILHHEINAEGVLLLRPLLDCPDAIIREGVAALLAKRDDEAEALAVRRRRQGWTAYQIVDVLVLDNLRANRNEWAQYTVRSRRKQALDRFTEYAYRWF